ncbi:hypothetical protein F965_00501 [Acinetobacter schindleri NIPH 900]|uniref:Uncharacterized protein n=1 Tax=Acinetobacter schindleri NIPH 900 TaxID=1217675 RepID=N8Y3N6_9GAMM|nr:hypothetical protein [Acinetobacter schindleri]ENV14258.1 hypothetical protein F965_00501 [Acinetobacter schindleri NIPH 900]
MDTLSYIEPLERSFAQDGLEKELAKAIRGVMLNELHGAVQDIMDYGCPHLGSYDVVERFAKQDGLFVLKRQETADAIMRVVYSNWIGRGSKRGLEFLEFALRLIWGNVQGESYVINRIWHSVAQAEKYPRFISFTEKPDHFLTSRVFVTIREDSGISVNDVSDLAPSLSKLVPANIVCKVTHESLNSEEDYAVGAVVAGKAFTIDTSLAATDYVSAPYGLAISVQNLEAFEDKVIEDLTNQEVAHLIDYIVVRYTWDDFGGMDLDTRTQVVQPRRSDAVGWGRTSKDGDYLAWGGESKVTSGDLFEFSRYSEAILINLKQLLADYPQEQVLKIDLKAYWQYLRNGGKVGLEVATYNGGTMEQVGFEFVNTGGEELSKVKYELNVSMQLGGKDAEGEAMGTIVYNTANQMLTWERLQ